MEETDGVRLHVVTGKGGTGKTTVALALGLALARGGRRVLVLEVEGRDGLAAPLGRSPLGYDPVRVLDAPGGGEVHAAAVDPEESLLEYLEMFYRVGRSGLTARTLRAVGALDFATSVAPGMSDVLLTGKLKDVVDRTGERGRPVWDAVVCDAPPTGRVTRFLDVNSHVSLLARMGPVRSQADSVMRVIRSSRTAVHVVTLLEQLPVQETAEALEDVRAHRLRTGLLVVNRVRPPLLHDDALTAGAAGGVDRAALADGLVEAGLDRGLADPLGRGADEHARRVAREQVLRARLEGLGPAVVDLPLLAGAPDVDGGLARLADLLVEQGVVPTTRVPA